MIDESLQLIHLTKESVEEYEKGESHKRIVTPARCPNCQESGRLRSLGYYSRYTTRATVGTPAILVRRFRCFKCRRTTSLLPSFAQPYRLVLNETIEAYMAGNTNRADVLRSADHLKRYRHQYVRWLPNLRLRLHALLKGIPHKTAEAVWVAILEWGESLTKVTLFLTRDRQITMFGQYKCHLPNPP